MTTNDTKKTKYEAIYILLYNLAQKIKYMKDLLVEIQNSTDEDVRIKHEINFKNYTFDCSSIIRMIQEEAGFFKCFSGIPPEQYGQPAFEEKDCLDLPENKQLVNNFASTISEKLTAIENSFKDVERPSYPEVTKEEWLESISHTKNQFLRQYEESKEEYPNLGLKLKDIFIDDEVVSLVKGFMCGPVGVFRDKPIEATIVQKYDNIYELIIFLKLQAKTKDIVLYMTYKEDDKYCFRGNFVDKE